MVYSSEASDECASLLMASALERWAKAASVWVVALIAVITGLLIVALGAMAVWLFAPDTWKGFDLNPFSDVVFQVPAPEPIVSPPVIVAPSGVIAQVGEVLRAQAGDSLPINPKLIVWERCRRGRCDPIPRVLGGQYTPRCDRQECDVGFQIRAAQLFVSDFASSLTPVVTADETSPEGWCRARKTCPSAEDFDQGQCAIPGSCRALDNRLLSAYRPMINLQGSEAWAPVAFESVRSDYRLELAGAKPQAVVLEELPTVATRDKWNLNIARCSTGKGQACYRRRSALLGSRRTTRIAYGRVWRNPNWQQPGKDPGFILQYWLYYYFDALPNHASSWLGASAWQLHESDWEHVDVLLDRRLKPIAVAFSQHDCGELVPWSKLQREGSRPVVYVALGSHANYPTQTDRRVKATCDGGLAALPKNLPVAAKDFVDVVSRPSSLSFLAPQDLVVVNVTRPPRWLTYIGRWGEGNFARIQTLTGWIVRRLGDAPRGPYVTDDWTQPLHALRHYR